jgi:hypothetical protein
MDPESGSGGTNCGGIGQDLSAVDFARSTKIRSKFAFAEPSIVLVRGFVDIPDICFPGTRTAEFGAPALTGAYRYLGNAF